MRMDAQRALELERMAAGRCPIHVRPNPLCSVCARIGDKIHESRFPEDAVELESALHREIIDYCNSQFPRWKFRHARMDRKTTEEIGTEDFTIFATYGRTFHFECKAKNRKRTTEQIAWAMEVERLGHVVHCIESMSQFLEIVKS